MDAFITVTSTGLFVYWCQRVWLLLSGPDGSVDETLDDDIRFGRRVLMLLRTLFWPPDLLLP